jgi:transglutaminase-like putative cysteine protease
MEIHMGLPGNMPQASFTPRRLWRGSSPSGAGNDLVAHDLADFSHTSDLPPPTQQVPMPAISHVRIDAVAPNRPLRIHIGSEFIYQLPSPTPMIVMLNVHESRVPDLEVPDRIATDPIVPIETYRDGFGNICCRFVAPRGRFVLRTDGIIRDSGFSDPVASDARQNPVEDLPTEALAFLLPSRYCESDTLSNDAWRLFGGSAPGWARVQLICDFVHTHVDFGYKFSRPTRTAAETYAEGRGVCRDFTHLGVAFCRAMNIPARYCMGYISDIGLPPPYEPMDLAAWMEVYLGDRWYTFDPRNNAARVGRILIARGRDAADVPLTYTFGPNQLTGFKVFTEELTA